MKIIGIDPGTNTAIAVYDKTHKKITDVFMTDFWGAYSYIKYSLDGSDIRQINIEVSSCKKNWQGRDGAAVDVGGIVRESNLLADGLEKLGHKVIRVHPTGKVDAKYIKNLTGWRERTNEHKRDAIMLCWGF